ncbi:MAG: VOC family protein [Planctomycetes bacterium]|nr:VOC family protein [Planctomycetota bacterium]
MNQEDQDKRIDYIEFATTDIMESKRFYSSVFGWKFTDYGPDYSGFEDGRMNGGFCVVDSLDSGSPLIVLYSKDLGSMEADITKGGGTIVKATFAFPGGRRFHFSDPSGNILAVWSDK